MNWLDFGNQGHCDLTSSPNICIISESSVCQEHFQGFSLHLAQTCTWGWRVVYYSPPPVTRLPCCVSDSWIWHNCVILGLCGCLETLGVLDRLRKSPQNNALQYVIMIHYILPSLYSCKNVFSFSCSCLTHTDTVAQLIPDADSPLYDRVQQYRQLLDGLPMDAYTHGCILHPELTTDSMIPKYATAEIRSKWSQLTALRRHECSYFSIFGNYKTACVT